MQLTPPPHCTAVDTVLTVLIIMALAPIVFVIVGIVMQFVLALLWQQAVQVHRTG